MGQIMMPMFWCPECGMTSYEEPETLEHPQGNWWSDERCFSKMLSTIQGSLLHITHGYAKSRSARFEVFNALKRHKVNS